MKEIILETIYEAAYGKVLIDNVYWPYSFNTTIEHKEKYFNKDNMCNLQIKDFDKFISLVEEYVNLELKLNRPSMKIYNGELKDRIKLIICSMLTNATTEDFANINLYLLKQIDFLKDNSFSYLEKPLVVPLSKMKESNLEIKRNINNIAMETPNRVDFTLKKKIDDEEVEYKLPSIYYAIREEDGKKVCYIYSIMNPKEKKNPTEKEIKYKKTINRLLYKLNDGVEETSDYKDYIEGKTDYYPEGNITDITHSFLYSLNVFISLLQKENIEVIKGVPYLPVRYNSRELSANRNDNEDKRNELLERNKMIQTNATNKFIRTFRRLAEQNPCLQVETYPFEVDEFITLSLSPRTKELDNMLLEDANNNIDKGSVSNEYR